ncbi:prepilin peptidase [Nitrosopumilus sp. K4]|nr:prepilin peptidase [Nitrosopumilus sp. K4]
MLVIGSIIDIWKREIHDYYWIGFASLGIIITLFEENMLESFVLMGYALIIAPFSLLIWRLGLFGGADAFALIVLAVIAPVSTFSENAITPFTVLSNAAILFVIPLLANLVRNIISLANKQDIFEGFEESLWTKIGAMIIGYRAKNPKFGFPIERIEGKIKKISLGFHHAENQEFCNKSDTWITPGIPYLLLISGGYLIQLVYGDVLISWFM